MTVEDDGPQLSDDQFVRMQKPFYTTKPEGLGLACRSVERSWLPIRVTFALSASTPAG